MSGECRNCRHTRTLCPGMVSNSILSFPLVKDKVTPEFTCGPNIFSKSARSFLSSSGFPYAARNCFSMQRAQLFKSGPSAMICSLSKPVYSSLTLTKKTFIIQVSPHVLTTESNSKSDLGDGCRGPMIFSTSDLLIRQRSRSSSVRKLAGSVGLSGDPPPIRTAPADRIAKPTSTSIRRRGAFLRTSSWN